MLETYKFIKELSETKGSKAKIKLLSKGLKDIDTVSTVLVAAYNPFVTYGIKGDKLTTVPDLEHIEVPCLLVEDMYIILEKLASRELTGSKAAKAVEEIKESNPILRFILSGILNKNLRCGVTSKSINKAAKYELIETFDVMLAQEYEEHRVKTWPVIVEPKIDGMRCVARYEDGKVEFLSRNGLAITAIPHLEKSISDLFEDTETKYIDGELTAGENFNVSISALRKKTEVAENVEFTIFNILTEDEFMGESATTFSQHVGRLNSFNLQLPLKAMSVFHVYDHDKVMDMFSQALDRGEEGLIVKDPSAIYVPKRSYSWMKLKDKNPVDLEITGCYEGEGKYTGQLGGFTAMFEGVEVRIGGGFKDAQRVEFYDNFLKYEGLVIEVKYHEVTPDGSLRHARFIKFRADKD